MGLSNGTFSLFDLGSVRDAARSFTGAGTRLTASPFGGGGSGGGVALSPIHTLSISQCDVGTVSINGTGEWLAFGASALGQLLVWEWQSESYVLKQQGHSCVACTHAYCAVKRTNCAVFALFCANAAEPLVRRHHLPPLV